MSLRSTLSTYSQDMSQDSEMGKDWERKKSEKYVLNILKDKKHLSILHQITSNHYPQKSGQKRSHLASARVVFSRLLPCGCLASSAASLVCTKIDPPNQNHSRAQASKVCLPPDSSSYRPFTTASACRGRNHPLRRWCRGGCCSILFASIAFCGCCCGRRYIGRVCW